MGVKVPGTRQETKAGPEPTLLKLSRRVGLTGVNGKGHWPETLWPSAAVMEGSGRGLGCLRWCRPLLLLHPSSVT